ncbi:MAG: hypothetical protein CYPHOPRED_002475 [Cyphobasidiales sp. Tagirdzhanova-0007]|nr:MAG: hypothetical protein CYPHOPRED_002475 [Cyphobasidiales sp. Tagirdzhanova-0007]
MMEMMNMTTGMMDNSTSGMMSMAMLPFHTTVGVDMLWFEPWMPADPSSTLGACIGLFFLSVAHVILRTGICIVDRRRLSGHSDTMEYHSLANKEQHRSQSPPPYPGTHPVPAFRWLVDAPRGLLEGFTTAIGYFLMLAVMLMNAYFFVSVKLPRPESRCSPLT